MALQTKKRIKNIGKIISVALFVLIVFTNIKIALLDDEEIMKGDIALFGFEIELFEATQAYTSYGVSCSDICYNTPSRCTYIEGVGHCYGTLVN